MISKLKKIKRTPWKELTLGEKIVKAVIRVIKIALIVGIIAAVLYALLYLAMLAVMAFLVACAWGNDSYYNRYGRW